MGRADPSAASGVYDRRPLGEVTRGKTARNRLRRVDAFIALYDPLLVMRGDGRFARAYYVDLGFGDEPYTTLESASCLWRLNPRLPVLGVEIEPGRLARALPFVSEEIGFRLGGFNLPLGFWEDGVPEQVRLVRAFNVLRQYGDTAVRSAYCVLAERLVEGGLIVEGTSDPFGRVWTANLARRRAEGLILEALVFSAQLRHGFDLSKLQAVLPKNLIHRMVSGEPIHRFFSDWNRAARDTCSMAGLGVRQWFSAAARQLAESGYDLDLRRRWLRGGWLVWRRPDVSFPPLPE